MDFKNMGEIDLKLHLLSGQSIRVDNLMVQPYTIAEIRDFGYESYMGNLHWLSVDIDDFIKSVDDLEERINLESQRSKLKTFDFFTSAQESPLLDFLMASLAMIFRTDDVKMVGEGVIGINFDKLGLLDVSEDGFITIDEEWAEQVPEEKIMVIHRENFDELVRVVKYQNFMDAVKKEDFNPANEKARKLAEQMERNRERVEAKKKIQQQNEKGEDGEIDISDIISAVSSKSHSINKLNIWELTLYQLYDEYSRLELIDNYDFSVKAMMAGAKEVDLKHWSSRI
jgi:hypothetical protein